MFHLNMMGGTHATACMEFLLPNAFNAENTRRIKDAVHIPVFIGHNIFTPEEAEAMLVASHGCSADMPSEDAVRQFIQKEKEEYGEMIARA